MVKPSPDHKGPRLFLGGYAVMGGWLISQAGWKFLEFLQNLISKNTNHHCIA